MAQPCDLWYGYVNKETPSLDMGRISLPFSNVAHRIFMLLRPCQNLDPSFEMSTLITNPYQICSTYLTTRDDKVQENTPIAQVEGRHGLVTQKDNLWGLTIPCLCFISMSFHRHSFLTNTHKSIVCHIPKCSYQYLPRKYYQQQKLNNLSRFIVF